MTDPMTRIADALELIALRSTRDEWYEGGVLRPEYRTVSHLALTLLSNIETRRMAERGGVPAPPSTDACIEMDRKPAPVAGNAPPPDDDPEWRDVPAERAVWNTVRRGDRFYTARGYDKWSTAFVPFADIHHHDDDMHLEMVWIKRKPAPQAVDVKAHELRAGDVILAMVYSAGDTRDGNWRVASPDEWGAACLYRVRLPRPAGEPSAKAKCPTCRCMLAPGTTCACCESTSGDDPPLPSLDRDEEPSAYCDTKRRDPGCECIHEEGDSDCSVHPSDPETGEPVGDWHRSNASGEGIARLRHTLLEIGAHSWAVGELHDQPWLMASRIVGAINAAHAHATRELRARCERAERERDEARAEFNGAANERDRAKLERIAAIARAEAAERVVEAAVDVVAAWRMPGTPLTAVCVALSNALDAARKDGAR